MKRTKQIPPEESFSFADVAVCMFKVLLDEYGFKLVYSSDDSVRFRTATVFVEITCDRRGYEVDLYIGRCLFGLFSERGYSLSEIRLIMGEPKELAEAVGSGRKLAWMEDLLIHYRQILIERYSYLLRGQGFLRLRLKSLVA